KIKNLNGIQNLRIKKLIGKLNSPKPRIHKDGFQIILDLCLEEIENENLQALITNSYYDKFENKRYSIIVASLNSYLSKGFDGIYEYHYKRYLNQAKEKKAISKKEITINNELIVNRAMRDSSNLIFNTFKYQLVKYLGIFNLMYKFIESQRLE